VDAASAKATLKINLKKPDEDFVNSRTGRKIG
jgi:hypothetical protein